MPPKTITAAQARAQAEDAARVAAALEAEEQAKAAAEAERHAESVAAWWQERRAGFPARVQGRRDSAWAEFATAVIEGGDAVSAFARYRVVDAEVGEDRESIDRYYDDTARAHAEAEVREYHELLREAGWAAGVAAGNYVPDHLLDEAAARADALGVRIAEWNAAHSLEPGMTPGNGINPPARQVLNASGLLFTPPAEALSFSLAVDRVISAHVDASLARVRQERAEQLAAL
ncbi:hypothetical protein ACLQ3H_00340 [Micromonospora saelicesensis]|uniref:hypothetical protein n=1 Tax=Micromonospora saelicesensis TaxID=285676 RepID=UPI003CEBAFA6